MTTDVLSPSRATLTFSTDGLAAREEMLLKSLVRLLDHRTTHRWIYSPAETADLHIQGEQASPASLPRLPAAAPVLHLGASRREAQHALCLPLQAGELERELNALGQAVLQGRTAAAAAAASASVPVASLASDLLQLRRWPPAPLLRSAERLRLAAVLSSGRRALADVQRASGVPMPLCTEFLAALEAQGLLLRTPAVPMRVAVPVPVSASAVQAGLLDRIRRRLRLGKPAMA